MLVSANKNSRGLCLEVCVQLVFTMAAQTIRFWGLTLSNSDYKLLIYKYIF